MGNFLIVTIAFSERNDDKKMAEIILVGGGLFFVQTQNLSEAET